MTEDSPIEIGKAYRVLPRENKCVSEVYSVVDQQGAYQFGVESIYRWGEFVVVPQNEDEVEALEDARNWQDEEGFFVNLCITSFDSHEICDLLDCVEDYVGETDHEDAEQGFIENLEICIIDGGVEITEIEDSF